MEVRSRIVHSLSTVWPQGCGIDSCIDWSTLSFSHSCSSCTCKPPRMLNNHRVEVATAIPGSAWKPISEKGNTFEGEISTDEGVKAAYVKVLPPDGVLKEALCAVLAKELNLPITQPYLVDLSNIRQYFAGL